MELYQIDSNCVFSRFSAKFLLGVMILNMVQIIQAALANMLHTSCTIRYPLPEVLKKFLWLVHIKICNIWNTLAILQEPGREIQMCQFHTSGSHFA